MTPDEYISRVRVTVRLAASHLPDDGLEDVWSLVEHDEAPEGMVQLAWAIVNAKVMVPASVVDDIYEHSAGLVDPDHLPANLRDYALMPD